MTLTYSITVEPLNKSYTLNTIHLISKISFKQCSRRHCTANTEHYLPKSSCNCLQTNLFGRQYVCNINLILSVSPTRDLITDDCSICIVLKIFCLQQSTADNWVLFFVINVGIIGARRWIFYWKLIICFLFIGWSELRVSALFSWL